MSGRWGASSGPEQKTLITTLPGLAGTKPGHLYFSRASSGLASGPGQLMFTFWPLRSDFYKQ